MKKILIIIILAFSAFLLCSCIVVKNGYHCDFKNHYAVFLKYGEGMVEDEGVEKAVRVGDKTILRAFDTDEYVFSHWELNNKTISEEREYVLNPQEPIYDFQRYYAVFLPKSDNKAIINVTCKKGKTLNNMVVPEDFLRITGGGYYDIGETATLQEAEIGIGIARYYAYDDKIVDGPVLSIDVEKNLNVTVTIEEMAAITIEQNEVCNLELVGGNVFFKEGEEYKVTAEIINEEYVPDKWQIRDVLSNKILCEKEWEQNYVFEDVITSVNTLLYKRIVVSLTYTDENIVESLPIEVVSATEDEAEVITVKPEKMIRGRGYSLLVTPGINVYLKHLYLYAAYSVIEFCGVEDIYSDGGRIYVPDPSDDFGEGCKLIIEAIPKSKAALVNIISDDEFIRKEQELNGKIPSSYYPSALEKYFIVAEKNKEYPFYVRNYKNLYAIYEVGCQFDRIENENGEIVSKNLNFIFTVDKDTNFYIKWKKKPVFDLYFDYDLTSDNAGYSAKISQLALQFLFKDYTDEISLPSEYDGKPVIEISDLGMCQYYSGTNGLMEDYSQRLPFKKIILPKTIQRIGKKAFAGNINLQVCINEDNNISYISPDAFWSTNDAISANLSDEHINMILRELHSEFICENSDFTFKKESDEHFQNENELAHYVFGNEFICIKSSAFSNGISAFELGLLYHEFYHHYQMVVMVGIGDETIESINILPSEDELNSWSSTPYDTSDPNNYWNHPLEITARLFARTWSGLDLN